MVSNWSARLLQLAAFLPSLAVAQNVFAHVIVGNTAAAGYTNATWASDIKLAASYGIDGFVLNVGTPYAGNTATQISEAFIAANNLIGSGETPGFRLYLMFDYLGGSDGPWPESDVVDALTSYQGNGAYFTVDGKMMVSTFEGTSNTNDWPSIRSAVSGGLYFCPDWTSLGPTSSFPIDLVDCAFSWDMWPDGPVDVNTDSDNAWSANFLKPAGKGYMMGVSPWFYTDLPEYNKAWVWRGDDAWSLRWQQTQQILPDFVQIVTWNDYGESHYVGPIVEAGIPGSAASYVDGYPHTAWLETLPYQIAAYKNSYNSANPAPSVSSEKIVFWYRTSPASAGSTEATGNDCPSAINTGGYQTCYAVTDILEDSVFAIVEAQNAGTATISIGGSSSSYSVSAGQNFISMPFSGYTGTVSVSFNAISGSGVDITASPASGVANFNTWVGCAGC